MQEYYRMSPYAPMYGYNDMHIPYGNSWQYQIAKQPGSLQQQQPQRAIRGLTTYTYPQNFRNALELIRDAIISYSVRCTMY